MVITKTDGEQCELCHKLIDNTPDWYKEKDGAFFDIEREYYGVSLEQIRQFNSKRDLTELLISQKEDMG